MKTKTQFVLTVVALTGICCFTSKAQITITQSSYPVSVLGIDTVVGTTAASTFPNLTSQTNATWDMTTITDSTDIGLIARVHTPAYEFADSNLYVFGAFPYQGNDQRSITSSGILDYDIIIPWTGYSLAGLTGGPNDSLIIGNAARITGQTDISSTPDTIIKFPATYNKTWSNNYERSTNALLTVAAFAYNHSPVVVKLYVNEKDTAKGWGTMRVKNLLAYSKSAYFKVLQVQTTSISIDSFFINGAPAPALVLKAFGFAQGMISKSYYQSYYDSGQVTALATVYYGDSTFTKPKSAVTRTEPTVNAGIANITNELGGVTIYPNPNNGNLVSINLSAPLSGEWSYQLIDITGRIIQSELLKMNSGTAEFTLPYSITTGVYYVRLNHNNQQFCIKSLDVIK